MSDELADAVQPEGQGGAGTADAPYAEYLNRIPEEVRGQVEPVFKEWDSNVTRRFQEASEYRKQWEPYEPLGVNELSPDEVAWALQFRHAAVQNPQAVRDWYQQYAEHNGLTSPAGPASPPAQQQPDPAQQYTDFGSYDPGDALKPLLDPIQQQLEQINQWRLQQETAAREAEAKSYIESQMGDIEKAHPDEFDRGAVERLVAQYIETDPQHAVQRAFADWQSIRNQLEKSVLQSKASQPPPPESGGTVNAAPEQVTTLAEANRIAIERIRQARSET